jgi:hypothetical protein
MTAIKELEQLEQGKVVFFWRKLFSNYFDKT